MRDEYVDRMIKNLPVLRTAADYVNSCAERSAAANIIIKKKIAFSYMIVSYILSE